MKAVTDAGQASLLGHGIDLPACHPRKVSLVPNYLVAVIHWTDAVQLLTFYESSF